MELHVITLCAIILAVEPATRLFTKIRNWYDRREAHRRMLQ
jgi:hypothetical protein